MADEQKVLMFGKSQGIVGNTESHLCLQTAGDVYIKTKNRYVPIFKNGKLNVDDSSEIFSVSSTDDIKKTGVYLVTTTSDDGTAEQAVYLCIDGTKILLTSSNESYISYGAVQQLTAENFLQAAKNIGLYFETVDEAKAANVTQGIVYILGEQKMYKVINGELTEMTNSATDSSSLTTDSESSSTESTQDSLQLGQIFLDGTAGIFSSEGKFIIQVDGNEYIKFMNNVILPLRDIQLNQSNMVYYKGGTMGESGFWLYTIDGESYLEIDNIIIHNSSSNYTPSLYSTYVGTTTKSIINSASAVTLSTGVQLVLKYPITFSVGDWVLLQTASGNKAEIKATKSDNGSIISVTLESPLAAYTTLKITYTYTIDAIDNTSGQETITISIDPTQTTTSSTGDIDNIYGEVEVSQDVISIDSMEIVTGDSDVYFVDDSGNQYGGSSLPTAIFARVAGSSPLIVEFPNQSGTLTTSQINNLQYSTIYKLTGKDTSNTVLEHENESVSLITYTDTDGALSAETITKVGNLSTIKVPDEDSYFSGYGIYTNQLKAYEPEFWGATFTGLAERYYPKYSDKLSIPTKYTDASYNKVIPTVEWVKALIDQATVNLQQQVADLQQQVADLESEIEKLQSS